MYFCVRNNMVLFFIKFNFILCYNKIRKGCEIMNRLQSEIKDYRKKKGLSQDDLAVILGVTRSKIANWENGRTFPKPDMIQEIANKLNINLTNGDLINDFIDYESTLKKKFKQIEENGKIEISDIENIIKILDESGIKISYKDNILSNEDIIGIITIIKMYLEVKRWI